MEMKDGNSSSINSDKESFDSICEQHQITERQKEIILLLSEGLEYKEIGYKLSIATKTVARHIQNIYDKTECHNKVEVVKLFNP